MYKPFQFSSVQSLSHVRLCNPMNSDTPASLSITNSRSSIRLTSIKSVMPSSHLILSCPLFLLPPIPPSIRVFSNESTLCMRLQSTGVSALASFLPKKSCLVLMGRTMLSKSLIQFSVDRWGCVPSQLFDLRPNYGGGNEDNGNLLQKVPCTLNAPN